MKSFKYALYSTLLFGLVNLSCIVNNAPAKLNSTIINPRTTKAAREEYKNNLFTNVIPNNMKLPLTDSTEKNWIQAFNAMELMLDKNPEYIPAVRKALDSFNERSARFQRYLLEAAYILYPDSYTSEVLKITRQTDNPKFFAMGVNYLLRDKLNKYNNEFYSNLLQAKFKDWKDNAILFSLNTDLMNPPDKEVASRPNLVDLLSHNFGAGNTVIFSIQRNDRDYTGIAILRKPDGSFVRNVNGTIFYIPQLARAITDYPSYITNGNTPQGVFSIQGIDTSKLRDIGRTPNIQLVMPFEANPETYFHENNPSDTVWTETLYSKLLPESWKNYFSIWGTYYAGKAGRSEIISHGTTIDPSFYKGQPYYPNTPTIGCLCAKEIWSGLNGSRLESDQAALIDAFLSTGSMKGYLVVVNLDNQKMPVVIDNVIIDVLKAEQILHTKENNIN
jgi:hypothetical protein